MGDLVAEERFARQSSSPTVTLVMVLPWVVHLTRPSPGSMVTAVTT
jgi:hypothetical protein